ncbi:TolC family protein [Aquimarina sp. AD1]|uniref:TolC family protein n=1 Tax=Aquimarina sp. (strain AD1) TaxID=1714848 RepID=UPI000E4F3908|nr:TolC family protein [Aquimarina sp. AD1]AXT54502.1 TolC family protein [Aquimarina sp. AD1]RKN25061.1 TolC family protein [Aquimarina sp. AD1]
MSLKSIICISVFLLQFLGFTQRKDAERYSLAQCVDIALKNNLDLKSSVLNASTAKINHRQATANILPSLNGNYNIGVNNGRSIDPFTNDFINQELTFSNARLNLDATIFNGFRLLNTVKQQRLNRQASEMEIEEAKQTLILNVTLAYLQVLNRTDILALAKARLVATNKQLKQQEDLYSEESGNPADYADIKGQKTIDETNILAAESDLNSAKLSLTRLMNIRENIDADKTSILLDFEKYELSSEDVFNDAMKNLATFKAKELRAKAAAKGIKVARAQYIPEISFFGQLNTNYSSVAETFTEIGSSIVETGDFVTVNNEEISVFTEQSQFRGDKIEYLDQFDNNLNTVVGIAVDIPLFNSFRAKNNVALEKIKAEESLIELERTSLEVKNAIAQVHFDMRAAFNRYESLQNQVTAFEESYRVNEIRFNNGVSNFIAYITSKNNLDNARTNLTNAKYEYLLRVKILEFYRGNTL